MFSYSHAKNVVLRATYEHLVYKADYETFKADEIHKHVTGYISSGYVQRLLTSLVDDGLVLRDKYDETAPYHYTVSDKGLEVAESLPSLSSLVQGDTTDRTKPILAPTADGVVPLNHNQPGYTEIAHGLDKAIEEALAIRPNELSGDEHATLVSALKAARELWNAFELDLMQVRVGLLMAIQEAEKALKKTFTLVKGPLLVEAIVAFFKASADGIKL